MHGCAGQIGVAPSDSSTHSGTLVYHMSHMSSTHHSTKASVVLGVCLPAEQAETVRERAIAADRSVSAELRRQLVAAGYLPPRAITRP